ncbi:MAG: hypothetical protein HY900_24605 [Deltaproteobacteria bacterium]|nr:hypothetical protein [Deltaproteobacteria bacterium]
MRKSRLRLSRKSRKGRLREEQVEVEEEQVEVEEEQVEVEEEWVEVEQEEQVEVEQVGE